MKKKVLITVLIVVFVLGLFSSVIIYMKVDYDSFTMQKKEFISKLQKELSSENAVLNIERTVISSNFLSKRRSVSITVEFDRSELDGTRTNAEVAALTRKLCVKYLESEKFSKLKEDINSYSSINIKIKNKDSEYPQLSNDLTVFFRNGTLRNNEKAVSDKNNGSVLFDKLKCTDDRIDMSELEYFSDMSEIVVNDIYAGKEKNYSFDKFNNLQYLCITAYSSPADEEKINMIKSQLSENCIFECMDNDSITLSPKL